MREKLLFSDIFKLFVFSSILFIASFHITNISLITSIVIIPTYLIVFQKDCFVKIDTKLLEKKFFLLPFTLLILFCVFYFTTAINYKYYTYIEAIGFSIKIILFYILGFFLANTKYFYRNYSTPFMFLCVAGGGIFFTFISLLTTTGFSLSLPDGFAERSVYSIWNGELINGPSVDMYSYLGVCLFPVIIQLLMEFRRKNKCRLIYFLLFISSVVLFLLSSYSALYLSARTPIFCFLGSILLDYFYKSVSSSKQKIFTIFKYGLFVLLPLLIFNLQPDLLENIFGFLSFGVFKRFEDSGLETPRYLLWLTVLTEMWNYPFGGREIILPMSERTGRVGMYAHNIWLDVAFDAGLLPMLFLLIFHCIHFFYFFNLMLKSKYNDILGAFLRCIYLAIFSAFIGSPVLQANLHYFATSCLFMGLVIGILKGKYYSNE